MTTLRHIIGSLALGVFALRCLVPTGFMLETTKGPGSLLGLEIVICSGHMPASSAKHDQSTIPQAPKPAKSSTSNDICPYSGHGQTANAASAPQPLSTIVRYAEVVYALTAQIYAATPVPGPTSARGPPSIA